MPSQGRFEKFAGPLVGYFAVKHVGYWSDTFVTIDDGYTSRPPRGTPKAALDAIIANYAP